MPPREMESLVISEIFSDSGELPKLSSFVAVIYYSLPEGGKLPGSPFIYKWPWWQLGEETVFLGCHPQKLS